MAGHRAPRPVFTGPPASPARPTPRPPVACGDDHERARGASTLSGQPSTSPPRRRTALRSGTGRTARARSRAASRPPAQPTAPLLQVVALGHLRRAWSPSRPGRGRARAGPAPSRPLPLVEERPVRDASQVAVEAPSPVLPPLHPEHGERVLDESSASSGSRHSRRRKRNSSSSSARRARNSSMSMPGARARGRLAGIVGRRRPGPRGGLTWTFRRPLDSARGIRMNGAPPQGGHPAIHPSPAPRAPAPVSQA
jgi:hypothetical protein